MIYTSSRHNQELSANNKLGPGCYSIIEPQKTRNRVSFNSQEPKRSTLGNCNFTPGPGCYSNYTRLQYVTADKQTYYEVSRGIVAKRTQPFSTGPAKISLPTQSVGPGPGAYTPEVPYGAANRQRPGYTKIYKLRNFIHKNHSVPSLKQSNV